MSEPKSKTLRERRAGEDVVHKRENVMKRIQEQYGGRGNFKVTRAEHKNIILIGRTRTGKSTIKSLLVDPTIVPEDLTLKADTRDPVFESFHVRDKDIILNIIDTPGLFEHGTTEMTIRDNGTILHTISLCANREITKLHAICFCVAITVGINQEDITSLKILVDFFGPEISRNSCLIVTRFESKNEDQRKKIAAELKQDSHFKEIASFFKLGIFFSGALNRDDYNQGNESLYEQFFTITDYREALIEIFTKNEEPFPVTDMLISKVRHLLKEETEKDIELNKLRQEADKENLLIQQLQNVQLNDREELGKLIKQVAHTNNSPSAVKNNSQPESESRSFCVLS